MNKPVKISLVFFAVAASAIIGRSSHSTPVSTRCAALAETFYPGVGDNRQQDVTSKTEMLIHNANAVEVFRANGSILTMILSGGADSYTVSTEFSPPYEYRDRIDNATSIVKACMDGTDEEKDQTLSAVVLLSAKQRNYNLKPILARQDSIGEMARLIESGTPEEQLKNPALAKALLVDQILAVRKTTGRWDGYRSKLYGGTSYEGPAYIDPEQVVARQKLIDAHESHFIQIAPRAWLLLKQANQHQIPANFPLEARQKGAAVTPK